MLVAMFMAVTMPFVRMLMGMRVFMPVPVRMAMAVVMIMVVLANRPN
jgi:hypothetical protein